MQVHFSTEAADHTCYLNIVPSLLSPKVPNGRDQRPPTLERLYWASRKHSEWRRNGPSVHEANLTTPCTLEKAKLKDRCSSVLFCTAMIINLVLSPQRLRLSDPRRRPWPP